MSLLRRLGLALVLGLLTGTAAGLRLAPTPAGLFRPPATGSASPTGSLQARVDEFLRQLPPDFGRVGLVVKSLRTGEAADHNADAVFEAASLYKLGVMLALFDAARVGDVDLDAPITIPDWAVNTGDWSVYYPGDVVSGWEALEAMIALSDNPTALVFMQMLDPERINRVLAGYGLGSTRVGWWEPTTTPADVARLLELIEAGRAVSPAASRQMRELLLRQRDNRRIPAGLPPDTPVAHKTGSLAGIAHDAGILYLPSGPVILVALTADLADLEAGDRAIIELTRLVADYFADRN